MEWQGRWRFIAWAAATTVLSTPALAQTSAQPGHLEQRFQPRPAQPSVGAPIEIPQTPHTVAPAAAEGVRFHLSAVRFDGNTVMPEARLQALAASYIGHDITLADAYALADRVTAAYRDAGFILARAVVPAQRISGGQLRLRIVEGYIDKVSIEGDAGGAREQLQAYGQRIAAQRPLTAAVLERELLLANDLTGLGVRSVLTPSETPGAADLTLVVTRRKVDGFLQADNRGSRYLGPYELMGGVFINDAFGTGGRLGVNAVVTPNQGPDLAYGGISFDQPLGANGLRLFTDVNYAVTKPGSVLREFDTRGRALNSDATLSYPFIRSRDFNLQGAVTFSYHDVHSNDDVVGTLFDDHIRALSMQVYGNMLDDWGGYSTLSVSLTQGLPVFGATRSNDPDKSHIGASGTYTRANFEMTHEQPLFDRISVLLGAGGQTSFGNPLLSSEQFSLGGDSFDRAFDPSEATGDSALAGRFEGRFDAFDRAAIFSNVQFYGFVEGGELWQSNVPADTPHSQGLASTGAGLRFLVNDRFNADLEWAKPIDRDVLAKDTQNSRFFFSVGMTF